MKSPSKEIGENGGFMANIKVKIKLEEWFGNWTL